MKTLVWFRSDLRVADNPALAAACAEADRGAVEAVFLLAPAQWREHGWGAPKVDFVVRNLAALRGRLAGLGIPLHVCAAGRFADALAALATLARESGCDTVVFNDEHEVNERRRDEAVRAALAAASVRCVSHHDQTVVPPTELSTSTGGFYSVFTPFRRAWTGYLERHGVPAPLPAPRPRGEPVPGGGEVPATLADFPPRRELAELWPAGEDEAHRRLERFVRERIGGYRERRDLPAEPGTSELSPYLALGVISPRQCLAAALAANAGRLAGGAPGPESWIGELVWREFYRHVLVGFPRVSMGRPFRFATDRVPWRYDEGELAAWREGRTGVPVVDAGMRALAATGWMHNRVRMITAMFLAKDLLLDWRLGEAHFAASLVDVDLASNNGGWQWSASTGTDAAPYFRIFNPVSQSRRIDADGAFIRCWVPELAGLPAAAIHDPTPEQRHARGYPLPIVDHAATRARAIAAFRGMG